MVLAGCAARPSTIECVDLAPEVCDRAVQLATDVLGRTVERNSWLAVVTPGKAGQLDHVEVHACLDEGDSLTVDVFQSTNDEPHAKIRGAPSPVNPCVVRRLAPQSG